jgi:predicted Zn-dependent peptidase
MVRQYFGSMRARTVPRRPEPEIERRPVRVIMREPGSPTLAMAWFKPAPLDPDDIHLDILTDILTGGQETRLHRRLVNEEQLAVQVSAFSGYPGERYTNLFFIEVTPAPGTGEADVERIEAIVQEELDRIAADGVEAAELNRVRNKLRADFIYRLRANGYLADVLSYYESVTGDYRNLFHYNAQLDTVTSKDIQHSVTRHLKSRFRMTAVLLPPPSAEKSDANAAKAQDDAEKPEATESSQPE